MDWGMLAVSFFGVVLGSGAVTAVAKGWITGRASLAKTMHDERVAFVQDLKGMLKEERDGHVSCIERVATVEVHNKLLRKRAASLRGRILKSEAEFTARMGKAEAEIIKVRDDMLRAYVVQTPSVPPPKE